LAVKTIAELPVVATLTDNDLLVIDDGSRNYAITWGNLKTKVTGVTGFTVDNTAGTITITLATGATLTVTPHDPTKQDTLSWDSTPTADSTKPVTSGGVKAALDGKQDTLSWDTTPTSGSSKPVTSGGVKAALDGKQDTLSWDTTPTSGSSKPVTSGGVKAALDAKQDTLSWDATPTANSTKPVTSGGVKAALDLKLDKADYVDFTGASSSDAGAAGKVPAPAAGGHRYLASGGSWQAPDTVPTNGSNYLITSDAVFDALLILATDIAPGYSSSATYVLGAYVTYNNVLYKCTTAITTAEAWNSAHWTAVNIGAELVAIKANVATNTSNINTNTGNISDLTTEIAKTVHVDRDQFFSEQEQYQARVNIGAIGFAEFGKKRYGVSGVGQSSTTLTRLYDAVGMTATPSTDATAGHSDFDTCAPFNRRKCVGYWTAGNGKAVFNVNAYEGDADYAEDGSMGDYVAVEVEPFYYYHKSGIMAVSMYPWPGYEIHPVCKDYDGNVRAKTYLPVYALAQDGNGKAVSLPGFQNQRGGYNDLRNYAATYNATGMSQLAMIEPSAVWHYEWLLMTIEFATTNMQSIMNGAVSMRYADDKIVAVPGANMIVVGSVGSNFVVGQTIYMGASYSASVNVRTDYNKITAIDKCNDDGTLNPSGSYYRFTYDGTDRSSSIVVDTWAVSTRPWCTGATAGYAPGVNAVKGHTGSPVSNTSGKYAMRYRWRENVYGNQNMTTLDLADLRVADGDSFHLDWYFLADPRKYFPYGNYGKADIQNTAKGWVKLGVSTPVASYADGYIKELGADANYPHVRVPVSTVGGGSTTYYADYAYLVYSHEVCAVRRGGHVSSGAPAGPCYFSASNAVSYANWTYGATLYFLQ